MLSAGVPGYNTLGFLYLSIDILEVMPKLKLSIETIRKIKKLRETGHSLPEIKKLTGKANATIFKYTRKVEILHQYKEIWKIKRGGSKYRAYKKWQEARISAQALITPLNKKDKLLILSCLYWGEGSKRELNLINSDPALIKVFIVCLKEIGVTTDMLQITLRIFEDMDKVKVVNFWANFLSISKSQISNVNILKGKKAGKLKHGICRIRVRKSAPFFKLIMSMIDLIKFNFNAAVVQWIERGTPKL